MSAGRGFRALGREMKADRRSNIRDETRKSSRMMIKKTKQKTKRLGVYCHARHKWITANSDVVSLEPRGARVTVLKQYLSFRKATVVRTRSTQDPIRTCPRRLC